MVEDCGSEGDGETERKKLRQGIVCLCVMAIVGPMALGGCGTVGNRGKPKPQETSEHGEIRGEIALTVQEMDILCKTYADEKRIRSGNLYSYQKKFLEQYQEGMRYLSEKYPSKAFCVLSGVPENKMNAETVFYFQENDQEISYELYVDTKEDGTYEIKDNYYGSQIAGTVEDYMEEQLKKVGFPVQAVSVSYRKAMGMDVNDRMKLEDIKARSEELGGITDIFLESSSVDEGFEKLIKKEVLKLGFYGSFYIYMSEPGTLKLDNRQEYKEYLKQNGANAFKNSISFRSFEN